MAAERILDALKSLAKIKLGSRLIWTKIFSPWNGNWKTLSCFFKKTFPSDGNYNWKTTQGDILKIMEIIWAQVPLRRRLKRVQRTGDLILVLKDIIFLSNLYEWNVDTFEKVAFVRFGNLILLKKYFYSNLVKFDLRNFKT